MGIKEMNASARHFVCQALSSPFHLLTNLSQQQLTAHRRRWVMLSSF